ncbi:MAG: hypothetical protein ACPG6P_14460 [Akkermansiaceae bacterium]
MHKLIYLLALLAFLPSVSAKEIKIKWRDTVEYAELAASREKAAKDKKFITILVSNKTYDSDNQGAQAAADVIEDTIKAMKSISIVVRCSYENARSIKQDEFGKAAIEGLKKAGNGLPMIVVVDPSTNKLVEVLMPRTIQQDGSKAFRGVKKKARELKKKK